MSLTLSQTRAELEKLGHTPRKLLGQNFLVDRNIVAKSLELADVTATDEIVEIGPGLGTLTRSLAESGARVWAVEFDATLAAYLRSEVVPTAGARLQILDGDAVEHPRADIPPAVAQSGFKVVANLPYAISTPWMAEILTSPLPERMVLMLQRETADRFTAQLGTKQFGAISIWLQSAFDVLPGHPVPPGCFHPAPDVESYLLNLRRKTTPFLFGPTSRQLIRRLFQQRRKQVGSLVKKLDAPALVEWVKTLADHGATPRSRPEAIPLAAWHALAHRVDCD